MGSTGRTSDTHPQPTTYIQRHLALSSVKVSPSRMDRITILLLLGGILVTCAQKPRFFKTKFEDCGSILDIAPALEGSVKMTAPFNRNTARHVLGKGKEVQICVEGKLNSTSNLPLPITAPRGLKNSAHGQVELGPLTVPLPVEFCSLTVDGCEGAEPACSAMKAGDNIKPFLSSIP